MQITEVKGHIVHLYFNFFFDKTTAFCFYFSLLILNKAIIDVFRLCLRSLSVTNDAYQGLDIKSKY